MSDERALAAQLESYGAWLQDRLQLDLAPSVFDSLLDDDGASAAAAAAARTTAMPTADGLSAAPPAPHLIEHQPIDQRNERSSRPDNVVPLTRTSTQPNYIARRTVVGAAAAIVVAAIAALAARGGSSGSVASPGATTSGTTSDGTFIDIAETDATSAIGDNPGEVTGLTVPETTNPGVEVGSTLPGVDKTVWTADVRKGMYGTNVKELQTRLADLKFAPGPTDGAYGEGTEQAVWAYKKLVLKTPRAELFQSNSKSLITADMWSTMQDPIEISPRRPLGAGTTHVEIYLPEQVMVVFTDDVPVLVTHIASGNGQTWCELVTYDTDNKGQPLEESVERDECGVSNTPGGVFKFYRRYEGNRQSPLGGMYNPVYFNYGIAVHGARNVPLEPASHGCIRVNMTIAEYFPDLVKNGNRVYVWGEDGKEPESYTKRQSTPTFNYKNPDASTTTSSSSTTSTTTPTSTTTGNSTATTTKPTQTTEAPSTGTSVPATTPPTTPSTQAPATNPPITQATTPPTNGPVGP